MDPLNPPARPRRGVVAVGAAAVAGTLATLLVVALPTSTAGAAGLEPFASCGEVAAWGTTSQEALQAEGAAGATIVGDVATTVAAGSASEGGSATAPTAAADTAGSADQSRAAAPVGADGGTNVVVAGVDELDLVERLGDDRALVVADDRLAVVDLDRAVLVAGVDVPAGAQVTYDAEAGVAWVVGQGFGAEDGRVAPGGPAVDVAPYPGEVEVSRVTVGDDALAVEATWTTSGSLVDARRVGDRLHLVATEGFTAITEVARGDDDVVVPFGDGPVPCDQVLHPAGASDPSATLLVTLPVTGALEPEHATEVVGAGQFVHVTGEAAYLATPQWSGDTTSTTIHRFDLATLDHTGSGRVDGTLLDEFSMSDHDGHLRVAVTHQGRSVEMPVPVDDVVDQEEPVVDVAPPAPGIVAPDAAVPGTAVPGTAVPDGDVVGPTAPGGEARNEVVVLDTEGDLDVVGRTERFGHPGETLHGVRFVGDVAYAVTFLQTDPFYVVDLASPTAPKVAGEVELPGFSAYLHPISDDLVAGFGPGEDGRAAVKLFDVSDPARPRVADDLALGDESAVVWDHHAFVDLGDGRFAVPATTYTEEYPDACTPAVQQQAKAAEAQLQAEIDAVYRAGGDAADPTGVDERADALYERLDALAAEGCLYPGSVPTSAVVVIDAADGELREVERLTTSVEGGATRLLPADAGWSVLGAGELVLLDPAGTERARLDLD